MGYSFSFAMVALTVIAAVGVAMVVLGIVKLVSK